MAALPERPEARLIMSGATSTELSRTLAGATVADAMTNGVISCSPDTPLRTGRAHHGRAARPRRLRVRLRATRTTRPSSCGASSATSTSSPPQSSTSTRAPPARAPSLRSWSSSSDDALDHAAALMAENDVIPPRGASTLPPTGLSASSRRSTSPASSSMEPDAAAPSPTGRGRTASSGSGSSRSAGSAPTSRARCSPRRACCGRG